MLKLRNLSFILSAAFLTASAAACSNSTTAQKPAEVNASSSSADSTSSASGDVIITMADLGKLNQVNSSGKKGDLLKAFNEADNGYQIVLKDYSSYYKGEFDESGCVTEEGMADVCDQIALDIIKGEAVDIIPMYSFYDSGKFFSLLKKGAFMDLTPFVEKDPVVNTSSLDSHILDICKTNGKLNYLPVGYTIDTLSGFTKYVGDKENWNMNELIDRWNAMPEDSTFNGHTSKDYVYYDLLRNSLSSFIDLGNASCSFDSPEFINILEFINGFASPSGYQEDINWNSPQFVSPCQIYGFNNFHELLWNEQNEPITFVGYPTQDGKGSYINVTDAYALSAFSAPEVQQGAWEFIKSFADEEYQTQMMSEYDEEYCFPVNISAFQNVENEILANAGKENIISMQGNEIEIGFYNNEEHERLTKFINSIDRISFDIEDDVYSIINDEILKMVFDGASPENVASNIQNRASILISEKNG